MNKEIGLIGLTSFARTTGSLETSEISVVVFRMSDVSVYLRSRCIRVHALQSLHAVWI
jgi:hypothetical protein